MAEARRSDSPAEALPTDALKEAGQQLLSLLAQRAAQAATDRVTDLTGRLTGIADNGGTGVLSAFRGERNDDDDDRRDRDEDAGEDGEERRSGIGGMLSGLKDKVAGLFGGGSGGGGKGKKLKVTVISESLDIGLPLRATYDLWTQYEDFASFMKKVEDVDVDDEKSNWKAQVFWSHREWEATTIEQVPDSHIVWKSTGAKGHVDGAVTFTGLGPNLTRVLLVMEYYPQGLFERTGNIWRAQGRRARLEFQHFRRHAMTQAILNQDEIEGWRGEIRDGEVVTTHEEAMEEEEQRRAAGEQDEAPEDAVAASDQEDEDEGAPEEGAEDADERVIDEQEGDAQEDLAEDQGGDEEGLGEADEYDEDSEPSDEYDEDSEPSDEYDEDSEPSDRYDETAEDSEGESDRNGTRRREPVGARSGRRR